MEQQFKLLELVAIVRKQWLFVGMLIGGALLCVTLYILFVAKPVYEADTQLLINQKTEPNERYSWDQAEADLKLINTYYVMVKSPIILNEVIATLNLSKTPKELEQQITIMNENDSTVITLTVQDDNPQLAVALVNTIASVFEKQVPQLMNVNNVSVLTKAELAQSEKPVSPDIVLYFVITAILSVITSVALAFVREMLNKSVKHEAQFEQLLQAPIIGVISPIRLAKSKSTRAKRDVRKKVRGAEVQ